MGGGGKVFFVANGSKSMCVRLKVLWGKKNFEKILVEKKLSKFFKKKQQIFEKNNFCGQKKLMLKIV